MNSSFSEETTVRKFLLGTLPPQDCEELEEKLFANEEFVRLIDLVEDEIIDEYVDGSLSPEDRKAVESYFLRPPNRQQKLKFARMLRSQLREDAKFQVMPARTSSPPRRAWFYWTAAGAVAAMLVATASLTIYTAKLRRDVETESARNRKDQDNLAQEQALNATLRKEADALRSQINTSGSAQSSYFTLVPSSVLAMGPNDLPVFSAHPGKMLRLKIPLSDMPRQPYQVSLQAANHKELWSRPSVKPAGNELIVPVQYNKWQKGDYLVVLTGTLGNPNPMATYYFAVSNPCQP